MNWDDLNPGALDFETSGNLEEFALQPWRMDSDDAWITCASVFRPDPTEALVPFFSKLHPTKEDLAEVLQFAIDHGITLVGWNIRFDIEWCFAMGLGHLAMQVKWLDGMLLWRHLDIEPEYEFQTRRHLKKSYALKPDAVNAFIPQFAGLDEDVQFHSRDPRELEKLKRYNDRDNIRAWTISKIIWGKLSDRQQRAALIEAEALPLVAQANYHGIDVDRLTVAHLSAKLDMVAAEKLAELAPDGMTEKIVRSPMQLAKLMFDDWGLPVLKENKSTVEGKPPNRSTDKEVLHELAFIDPRVRKIKEYRETLNAKGKFCTAVLESLDYNGDGKTHPIAKIFSTYTGRMTVSSKQGKGKDACQIGFALHQMKREKEFREIITAPVGYDLVEFDAAGQEFRWMAVASGDPTMLSLCEPGEDAHSYMGAEIVGMDYPTLVKNFHEGDKAAEQNRYLGKFANLSLQYRTSAKKLRSKARVDYDIPLELPEAYRIHATYQRVYPGVPDYWEKQIALVKACGYVETFAGNRINVVGNWNGKYGWSMGSTAINARIQGTGAQQKHLAMKVLKPLIVKYDSRFLFDLHDGLYMVIPSAIRQKAVEEMKTALDNLPYREEWGFTPPIPMPWDCKVGRGGTPECAWGRMKEVKFA